MTGDESDTDWGDLSITDGTDRNLITDISESFAYLSNEGRVQRRKQKLRNELVRAHIEQQIQAPSILQSLVNKLTRSP
ncbi:MAG: hypothetical protein GY785_15155 [Gammaproteobacteria bacterium]|nr:hypothetical protein [Gammaproteobacteria bacterium]